MSTVSGNDFKNAAALLWEAWKKDMEQIPLLDPSPEFDARMHQRILEQKKEALIIKRQKKRQLRRRVAVAAAIVIAVLAGWLLLDKTAYAKVSKWFKSLVGTAVQYDFSGDISDYQEEFPQIRLGWIPEGGTVLYEGEDESHTQYMLVVSYVEEGILGFTYGVMHEGHVFNVFDSNGEERNTVVFQMGAYSIEGYISSTEKDNDYVWFDEDKNIYFTLTSSLPHEINCKILENIQY